MVDYQNTSDWKFRGFIHKNIDLGTPKTFSIEFFVLLWPQLHKSIKNWIGSVLGGSVMMSKTTLSLPTFRIDNVYSGRCWVLRIKPITNRSNTTGFIWINIHYSDNYWFRQREILSLSHWFVDTKYLIIQTHLGNSEFGGAFHT